MHDTIDTNITYCANDMNDSHNTVGMDSVNHTNLDNHTNRNNYTNDTQGQILRALPIAHIASGLGRIEHTGSAHRMRMAIAGRRRAPLRKRTRHAPVRRDGGRKY